MTYDGTDRVAHILGGFSRDERAGVTPLAGVVIVGHLRAPEKHGA